MALHDPESSQKEKNLALKLGRQKKIQIIDGQQVEVLGGFDDEDEEGLEDDGEMGHPGMAGQVRKMMKNLELWNFLPNPKFLPKFNRKQQK